MPGRMVLRPVDIQNIAGVSKRTAQRILKKIRQSNGKRLEEYITAEEFSNYYGLKEDMVKQYMK